MKKSHWFLLILSAILYAIPFLFCDSLWWLIFIFPVPLLYVALTQNISFIHGYVWGVLVFLLHCYAGIFIVADLARESWWIGFALAIVMAMWQALVPALLFLCAAIAVNFFFLCARPELVEGFPRALEDILQSILCIKLWRTQQVQGERGIKVKSSYYSKMFPLIRIFLWTTALALFIFWTDRYCLYIFGMHGYPFMHPLMPLAQQPAFLWMLPILGKQLLTLLFLLVPVSLTLLLWYRNGTSTLLCIAVMLPWFWSQPCHKEQPVWHKQIKSLPCMIRAHSASAAINILTYHIKKLVATYPETSIIIMPESALDNIDHTMLHGFCTKMHLICGACCCEDENRYNSLYWIHNGAVCARFNKKDTMILTEHVADWMNADWLRKIYFKDKVAITRSCNERMPITLSDSISFVPYICSELFFNEHPDDCYPDISIVVIVNDTLLADSYMQELLLLLARFKAIQWQRDIAYVSYAYSVFIDREGNIREINQ